MLWEAGGVRCGSGNKSELVGGGRNQSESVRISWNARETDQVSLSWLVAVQKEAGVYLGWQLENKRLVSLQSGIMEQRHGIWCQLATDLLHGFSWGLLGHA